MKFVVKEGDKVLYTLATEALADDHAFVWNHYHEGAKAYVERV